MTSFRHLKITSSNLNCSAIVFLHEFSFQPTFLGSADIRKNQNGNPWPAANHIPSLIADAERLFMSSDFMALALVSRRLNLCLYTLCVTLRKPRMPCQSLMMMGLTEIMCMSYPKDFIAFYGNLHSTTFSLPWSVFVRLLGHGTNLHARGGFRVRRSVRSEMVIEIVFQI